MLALLFIGTGLAIYLGLWIFNNRSRWKYIQGKRKK
jgi:hypothetical protein